MAVHNSDINGQPVKCSWGKESGEPIVSQNASQVCSSQVSVGRLSLSRVTNSEILDPIADHPSSGVCFFFFRFRRRSAAHSSRTLPRRTANNLVTGTRRATRLHSSRDSSCRASKVTRTDSSATSKGISGKWTVTTAEISYDGSRLPLLYGFDHCTSNRCRYSRLMSRLANFDYCYY